MREQALGHPEIDAPLVPPVGAFDYHVGTPYAIYVRHPLGSFLVQGSAGYVEGSLAGFDADVVFLGIGGLGTQTADYREAYWKETVTTTGAARVIPIHWDSLMGPIEGPFTGELRVASFLSSDGDQTLDFLREKIASSPGLRIRRCLATTRSCCFRRWSKSGDQDATNVSTQPRRVDFARTTSLAADSSATMGLLVSRIYAPALRNRP